jgi:hypothetical protein
MRNYLRLAFQTFDSTEEFDDGQNKLLKSEFSDLRLVVK